MGADAASSLFNPNKKISGMSRSRRRTEVAVIGAGPAGLAAGIQLRRYGINPLVLDRDGGGGLLRNANLVENYPGFPGGIPGPELVRLFLQQAHQAGVEIIQAEVTNLDWGGGEFCIETPVSQVLSPRVVIASGTTPRKLSDLGIPVNLSRRIFYEVYAMAGIVGAVIAIVGAGDAAFDYALNLARRNRVILLNRGENVRCLPLLFERASTCPEITYRRSFTVLGLETAPNGSMVVRCLGPGGEERIEVDYLVGALGREPQMNFLSADLLPKAQELEKMGKLYWVGDVRNGLCRQTSIAVGDGVRAAMQIYMCQEQVV